MSAGKFHIECKTNDDICKNELIARAAVSVVIAVYKYVFFYHVNHEKFRYK